MWGKGNAAPHASERQSMRHPNANILNQGRVYFSSLRDVHKAYDRDRCPSITANVARTFSPNTKWPLPG